MSKINDSRESILAKIKSSLEKRDTKSYSRPDIPVFPISGDVLTNFTERLKGFDGSYQLFKTRDEALLWLRENIYSERKIFSAAEGIDGNVALMDFATPAEMHVIDVCIAEAILGVGETGSLLVDARSLGDPAAALFSTDLYLLIDRDKILPGMQEAYEKVNLADYQYSSFFSGPSATADIEAVHITGAQGEISLTALIYGVMSNK